MRSSARKLRAFRPETDRLDAICPVSALPLAIGGIAALSVDAAADATELVNEKAGAPTALHPTPSSGSDLAPEFTPLSSRIGEEAILTSAIFVLAETVPGESSGVTASTHSEGVDQAIITLSSTLNPSKAGSAATDQPASTPHGNALSHVGDGAALPTASQAASPGNEATAAAVQGLTNVRAMTLEPMPSNGEAIGGGMSTPMFDSGGGSGGSGTDVRVFISGGAAGPNGQINGHHPNQQGDPAPVIQGMKWSGGLMLQGNDAGNYQIVNYTWSFGRSRREP